MDTQTETPHTPTHFLRTLSYKCPTASLLVEGRILCRLRLLGRCSPECCFSEIQVGKEGRSGWGNTPAAEWALGLLSEQRLWRKELGWDCRWEELVSGEGRAEGSECGERRPGPKFLVPAGQLWGFGTVILLLSLNSFSLIITMSVTPIWPTPPCDFETVINTIRESTVEI